MNIENIQDMRLNRSKGKQFIYFKKENQEQRHLLDVFHLDAAEYVSVGGGFKNLEVIGEQKKYSLVITEEFILVLGVSSEEIEGKQIYYPNYEESIVEISWWEDIATYNDDDFLEYSPSTWNFGNKYVKEEFMKNKEIHIAFLIKYNENQTN